MEAGELKPACPTLVCANACRCDTSVLEDVGVPAELVLVDGTCEVRELISTCLSDAGKGCATCAAAPNQLNCAT